VSGWINVIEVSIANVRVEARRICNAEAEEQTRKGGGVSQWCAVAAFVTILGIQRFLYLRREGTSLFFIFYLGLSLDF
jgi:hypothetical protein